MNKLATLELLLGMRALLYHGVVTGTDRAGAYGKYADGKYCIVWGPMLADAWSLQGSYIQITKDGTVADKYQGQFRELKCLFDTFNNGTWSQSSCIDEEVTAEKVFALLDKVQAEVEKW